MKTLVPVKIKVEISQNFVAFSEYINFTWTPAMNPVRARSVCWKVDKYFIRVCWGTAQSRLGAPGVEAPEPVALDTGKETAEIAQW